MTIVPYLVCVRVPLVSRADSVGHGACVCATALGGYATFRALVTRQSAVSALLSTSQHQNK